MSSLLSELGAWFKRGSSEEGAGCISLGLSLLPLVGSSLPLLLRSAIEGQ